MQEAGGLEEERRLCYVGMTRAEQRLVLSYAYSRKVFGRTAMRARSRFLREIPPGCIEKLSPVIRGREPVEEEFRIGDLVSHQVFGQGRVLQISGRGAGLKVRVEFVRHGPKTLMQAYAKMRKLS